MVAVSVVGEGPHDARRQGAARTARIAQQQAEMALEEAELEMQERRRALDARKAQLASNPDGQDSWAGAGSK